MRLIVHGGAGSAPDEPTPRQATLDEAAEAGAKAATPVDAVEAAVRVLESDERFNAGVGGAVQSDGVVRTDAGLMTDDRTAGAACAMPGVEHAISAARVVMEETPHVLVSGEQAVDLAADFDVETDVDLLTDDTHERYESAEPPEGGPAEHLEWLRDRFGGTSANPQDHDTHERGGSDATSEYNGHGGSDATSGTVGAVATDGNSVAAATSTGGRWFALAGRVGDVPQIGSGFYCAPAGGASATGAGEDIARTTLSRRAVSHLESGLDAQAAADRAIEEFAELTGSSAGVIVLDEESTGSAYNSEDMQISIAVD